LADSALQPFAIVDLQFQFALSPDVVEVFGRRVEVAAVAPKHLNHHLRRLLERSPNLFYLLAG
jgi:hypothetical protein